MNKHLLPYIKQESFHKFVFIEKTSKSVYRAGLLELGNIMFLNNNVLFFTNESDDTFFIFALTTKPPIILEQVYNIFHNYKTIDKSEDISIAIVYERDYSDLKRSLKSNQFIQWYIFVKSICLNVIHAINKIVLKYNSPNVDYKETETAFISIRMDLQKQEKKFLDNLYKQQINTFF